MQYHINVLFVSNPLSSKLITSGRKKNKTKWTKCTWIDSGYYMWHLVSGGMRTLVSWVTCVWPSTQTLFSTPLGTLACWKDIAPCHLFNSSETDSWLYTASILKPCESVLPFSKGHETTLLDAHLYLLFVKFWARLSYIITCSFLSADWFDTNSAKLNFCHIINVQKQVCATRCGHILHYLVGRFKFCRES